MGGVASMADINTTDSFRLNAASMEGLARTAIGMDGPSALPEAGFVGVGDHGLSFGMQKEIHNSESRTEQAHVSDNGTDATVTENRSSLTVGAGMNGAGPYGFVEGSMSREQYEAYGAGEEAFRSNFEPSIELSLQGYANTQGGFGASGELIRRESFLSNSFGGATGELDTHARASVGFDSDNGLKACVGGGVERELSKRFTAFAEGTGCITQDGLGARVDAGISLNDSPIPVEAGITMGTNAQPQAYVGIAFRR